MATSTTSTSESLPVYQDEDDTEPRAAGLAVADLLSAPSAATLVGVEAKATPSVKASSSSPVADRPSTSKAPSPDQQETKTTQESIAASSAEGQKPETVKDPTAATTTNDGVAAYQYTAMQQILEDRDKVEYILSIREQPKHSRMCGVGEKADRRPIDPAPIIQLRVILHDHGPPSDDTQDSDEVVPISEEQQQQSSEISSQTSALTDSIRRGKMVRTSWGAGWENKTWYLENPYYFMYAMLADADTDEELHLLQDGKTRYTTGSCVSCLYHLKDIDGTEQGFFVFPDLSIRVEGRYRLKLCLFETIGHEVFHCKSVFSTPFNVYTAKRFPGMEESTMLSRSFADQGLKVRVRRNPRIRRGRISGKRKDILESDDDSAEERMLVEAPILSSQRPSVAMIKRFRSNDGGQQACYPYEQQQQYQSRPPRYHNTQETTSGYPSPVQLLQYRQSHSPHLERRYTDSSVAPPQDLRGGQEVTRTATGGDARYSSVTSAIQQQQQMQKQQQQQKQHNTRMQSLRDMHQNESLRSQAYPVDIHPRYSKDLDRGGIDADRGGAVMRHNEQQPLHRSHQRLGVDTSRQPLPTGLPSLQLDDYKSRQDRKTVLPSIHHALSSYHPDQSSMYLDVRPRPSSGGTSPRSTPASAYPRKMLPLPANLHRLTVEQQRRDESQSE